jgi:ABC-type sugar transport system substrate-binding protein
MSNSGDSSVLVLVRDLIFSSRIAATAKAEGVLVVMISEPAHLTGRAGTRLIVDLNQAGAIEAAAAWGRSSGGEVIGFVSHVDGATIARAREAGFTRIMPRSRFVEELPQLLRAG